MPTNEETTAAARSSAARVVWDDADVRMSHASVCNVTATREEVSVMFGTHVRQHADREVFVAQLNDRVILSPYGAKRLAMLIRNVVAEYENRFGSIDVAVPPDLPRRDAQDRPDEVPDVDRSSLQRTATKRLR